MGSYRFAKISMTLPNTNDFIEFMNEITKRFVNLCRRKMCFPCKINQLDVLHDFYNNQLRFCKLPLLFFFFYCETWMCIIVTIVVWHCKIQCLFCLVIIYNRSFIFSWCLLLPPLLLINVCKFKFYFPPTTLLCLVLL